MDLTLHNEILDTTLKPVHIGINGGKIIEVSESEIIQGEKVIDAKGAMVSPAFIESHFHLENVFLQDVVNRVGTLREAVDL